MSIAFVGNGPSGTTKVAQATLPITGVAVAAGLTVIICAVDTSASTGSVSCTDTAGNTWTKIIDGTNTGSTSTECDMWACTLTNALLSTDTITITWPSTGGSTGHVALSFVFSGLTITDDVAPQTAATASSTTSTTPSVSITPVSAITLIVGAVGLPGPVGDTFTDDSDTTNGSWSASQRVGTTGGSAASNNTVSAQYKITTAAGAQTYNPVLGTARQWSTIAVALQPAVVVITPVPARMSPLLMKFGRQFKLHNNILIPADSIRVNYVDSVVVTSITSLPSGLDTFPSSSILDNFNRADESPLSNGGQWSQSLIDTGPLNLVSNQIADGNAANSATAFWNPTTWADVEVYCDAVINPLAGNGLQLWARCDGVAVNNAYFLRVRNSGGVTTWDMRKRVGGGSSTSIATSTGYHLLDGDSIGFSVIGNTLTAYYKPSAGSWTLLFQASDSSITAAGMIGATIEFDTAARIDNFGGGAPVTVTPDIAQYVDQSTIVTVTSVSSGEIYAPLTGPFDSTRPLLLNLARSSNVFKLLNASNIINPDFIPVAAFNYTDSATITSVTSVQSTESIDWLDTAGSINGVSSVITTETVDYVESATITSVTTLTVQVETYPTPLPQQIPLLVLLDHVGIRLLHNNILNPDDSVRIQYTDSATINSVTSTQSTESTDWLDTSGSINGVSSVIYTETVDYVELSTVTGVTSVASVEVYTPTPVLPAQSPLLISLRRAGELRVLVPVSPTIPAAGTNYVDSATVSGVTSVQSTESTDWLDTAGSVNGTSSVLSTETSQYVEASTLASATVVSYTETVDYVEAATITSITSLTFDEQFPTPPAYERPLLFGLSRRLGLLHNNILNPDDSIRVVYVDSGAISSTTSVQSTENTDWLDTAGSVNGVSSVLVTETVDYVETATITSVTSVTTIEIYQQATWAPQPLLMVLGRRSRLHNLILNPDDSVRVQYTDSATISSTTSVITTESVDVVDSVTGATVTTVISLETVDYVETATIASITTISSVEQYIPLGSVPYIPPPLLIRLARQQGKLHLLANNRLTFDDSVRVQYVDSATIAGTTSVSATETTDWLDTAGTINGTTSLTTTETTDYVETTTIASITTLTYQELYPTPPAPQPALLIRLAFNRGRLKFLDNTLAPFTPPPVNYTDNATISGTTSLSSTDITDFVDGVSTTSKTSVTYTESPSYTDALTPTSLTTATSTDTSQYVDGGLPITSITYITSVEDYTQFINVYSELYVVGARPRWAITEAAPRWFVSGTRQRWQIVVSSPRWAVQGVKRRWAEWIR